MKFIGNAAADRVVDLIRPWLKTDHQLDVASLSLFAFAEVLAELPLVSKARLLTPAPPGEAAAIGGHERIGLLGAKADLAARNKLQAPWLAREFAAWLEAKAQIPRAQGGPYRSAKPQRAAERRVPLQVCRGLDAQIAGLRSAVSREKQMAHQVALNLEIKALLASRRRAVASL
ncbi:DUF4391 domain-containing protein [Variovorax sp. Root318D1]|uniref:DUF4391 domain-containing protein n=1 Tax=Variovorax sp. Root318D1 TaxID=1736513 RepID=UPI0009EC0A83|nr:DUF4391 domain-containing protein [Variovorax sp. Root318D1]